MVAQEASSSVDEETGVDATAMWEAELDSEGAATDETTTESETVEDQTVEDEIDEELTEEEAEDDDEEIDDDEAEEQEEMLTTVKINGEERQVTQEQLVTGFSQNEAYTQKSQKLAGDRKEFEEEREQSQEIRDRAIQVLQTLEAQNQQPVQDQAYWDNLEETDPIKWMKERDALREAQHQAQLNQTHLEELRQHREYENSQKKAKFLEEQEGVLLDLIPAWADENLANRDKQLIVEYGRNSGYDTAELNNLYDARAVITLLKAAKYDKVQEKRKGLVPKTRTSMKPGSQIGETKKLRMSKASKRLKQSGSVKDLADVFKQMI